MNTSATEKSNARWFYIAQAACIILGGLLVALCVPVLLGLRSELPKVQVTLATGLFLILMMQWAILSVLIMIFLDPKRRAV